MDDSLNGLYAITDGSKGRVLFSKTEAALRGGARILQYRDKTTDTARRQQEAQQLLALCKQYDALFIVNDDVELAQQAGAHGVHVGKDDAALSAARTALGDDAIIGVSCYNRLELAQTAQDNGADYVAFGSMFASPTKPNAPRASLALLQEAQQTLHVPICTIGGITLDNAPQLIHNGAAMIAVISELFAAEQTAIQRNAQQFSQLF